MQYMDKYLSPLGGITLAGEEDALTGLWFDGQKYFGSTLRENVKEQSLPVFERTKEWLALYFSGKNPEFTPPLKFNSTVFRTDVWKILMDIPYGQTVTYKKIAEKMAEQMGLMHMSAQAVGSAVAHNPISLIVPCHRVVGTNGSLTGYAGGLDKKTKLLAMEKTEGLFVPKGNCFSEITNV